MGEPAGRLAEDLGAPRAGPQQAEQQLERRGLAGAVRAEKAVDLPLGDFEVEPVDRHGARPAPVRDEDLGQALGADDGGHGARSPARKALSDSGIRLARRSSILRRMFARADSSRVPSAIVSRKRTAASTRPDSASRLAARRGRYCGAPRQARGVAHQARGALGVALVVEGVEADVERVAPVARVVGHPPGEHRDALAPRSRA